MVTRVEGVVNGLPIAFQKVSGNMWEATIPGTLNGIYIVEMTAYDDAGNRAYTSRYILMYDPKNICVKLEPYPYDADQTDDNYAFLLEEGEYSECLEHTYDEEIETDEYFVSAESALCGQNAR